MKKISNKSILFICLAVLFLLGIIALIVCAIMGLLPMQKNSKSNDGTSGPSGDPDTPVDPDDPDNPVDPDDPDNPVDPDDPDDPVDPVDPVDPGPSSGGGGGSWFNIYNTTMSNSYGYKSIMEDYSSENAKLPDGSFSTLNQSVRQNFVNLLQNKTRTGLWLDSYEHISFLEDALESMKNTEDGPTKILFLFYDLPNRDCAAASSNGSLCCTDPADSDASFCDQTTMKNFGDATETLCVGLASGMIQDDGTYGKSYEDYADRVVQTIEKYPDFEYHIVCEPDSFPNILTNSTFGGATAAGGCSKNTAALSYCAGIDYALRRLTGHVRDEDGNLSPDDSTISTMFQNNQIFTYLDVAHSAWGGWDVNLGDANKGVMYSLLMGATSSSPYVDTSADAYSTIGTTDNFGSVDTDVYSKPKFWWNTAQWMQMLAGFTMNVSNYTPLGYMIPFSNFTENGLNKPPEVIRDYCGWQDYSVTPNITPPTITPDNSESIGGKGAECMNPCNNIQAYNFTNNLMNYAGILATIYQGQCAKGVAKDGVVYPRILIDTARNGGAPDVFKANYEALVENLPAGTQPEPCASWCNVASMSLGQPSFGDDNNLLHPSDVTGSYLPFISFAYMKPPGESDGCVPSAGTSAPNPQDTTGKMTNGCTPSDITGDPAMCVRFDTMCGHEFAGGYGTESDGPGDLTYTDQTKNYIKLCPPDAGVWDLYQIDMLASNFNNFTQTSSGQKLYATKNNDEYWDGNTEG